MFPAVLEVVPVISGAVFTAEEREQLPAVQGRGMDSLPPEITAGLTRALVCSLDIAELRRAFGVTSGALLVKIERVDAGLANRLTGPLRELVS